MIRITTDIFSGRPNPTYLAEADEATELLAQIAQSKSAIVDDAHVHVRVDGPGLEGAQDRRFPVRGAVLGIQEIEQSARSAAGIGAVGREAEREMSRVGPGLAEDTRRKAVLKLFQTE